MSMPSMRFKHVIGAAAAAAALAGGWLLVRQARHDRPADGDRTRPRPLTLHGRHLKRGLWIAVALLAMIGSGTAVYAFHEQAARAAWATRLTGGDPAHAPGLMIRYGCAGCHSIAGVPGARGTVGPALRQIADRGYIGGVLSNTPENLVRWIRQSRDIDRRTAMPNTGATEQDARDMAAFLYMLPD